jgi:hypothetical protein
MRANIRDNLESLAGALVGLSLLGSLGYCALGIVTTLAVEHLGWFDMLAPFSAWMLSTLHIAAYLFATCCVLAVLGVTGSPLRLAIPVTMALPFWLYRSQLRCRATV